MSDQFNPLVSVRVPSDSEFFELFLLSGPRAVADIGNGSQRERFGWNWLVVLTRERELQAWQEQPAGSGAWVQQNGLLPPIFGTILPEGSRRVTAVFDQSGRMIVGYEHEELVRVTRWDVATQQYVQNVTFPGVNPALTTDLQGGINVGDSDVLLYYQPPGDLRRIHCRVQRELYLTTHEVWFHDEPVILDRAQVNSLQLELLVSDAAGNTLRDTDGQLVVLASDYYPRFVQDNVILDAVPTVAEYVSNTLVRSVADSVWLDAVPTVAQYVGNTMQRSVTDHVMLDAVPTVAVYRDNTELVVISDSVMLDATPTVAEYTMYVVANPKPVDHVILDATPTVAIYREV